MDLSNRDIGFLFWITVVALILLSRRDARTAVVHLISSLRGKVAGIVITFAVYIVAAVLVAQRLGAWNAGLLKDTIGWFLVPGLVLLFGFSNAYEGRGYYGRTLTRAIGLTALIESYVNVGAFPLPIEMVLLPLAVLLSALSAVSDMTPETRAVKPVADRLLGLVGLLIIVGTGIVVVRD